MKGKLFGIGVGPGDKELITLKAINKIKECKYIAVPIAGAKDKTAYSIIEDYLQDKVLIDCIFCMDRDLDKRKTKRQIVANDIMEVLTKGEDVGFITLGDPSIYSTYTYIAELVERSSYETIIIPGITSFSTVASIVNTSLVEGNSELHIVSGQNLDKIDEYLNLTGNKVIMKSGRNIAEIIDKIETNKKNFVEVKIVENASMENEKVYNSLAEVKKDQLGYFSVIIIKEQ